MAHVHATRDRRGDERLQGRGRFPANSESGTRDDKADYMQSVRTDRGRMRRPDADRSLSWRLVDCQPRLQIWTTTEVVITSLPPGQHCQEILCRGHLWLVHGLSLVLSRPKCR